MRKLLFILFFNGGLIGVAQKNSMDIKFAPTLTGIGKPIGEKVSQQIDKDGGKIISADKKMELIIPPDAVSKKTDISITPVENLAPGGSIGSYKLEPSGINFNTPAQIIFHYTDADYNGSNQNLQSIAFQDNTGQWYRDAKVFVDTIQKKITGSLTHFSSWAVFDYAQILPGSAKIRLGRKQSLSIVINSPKGASAYKGQGGVNDDDLLAPPTTSNLIIVWQVNSVPDGDAENGTVSGDNSGAIYTAPNSIPERNPVAVTAEAAANVIVNDVTYSSLKLVSHINVYDGWHYTFIGYSSKGCFRMIDSSSCDIRVEGNKVIVSNIINYKAWSDWPQCDKDCTTEYTNKDSWKGLVEIWGVASANFTPATENSPAKIYITLIPAIGNTPGAKVTCPKDTRNIPSMPMPAQPNYISFDITGPDEVLIHYGGKSSNVVLYNVVKGDGFVINMSD